MKLKTDSLFRVSLEKEKNQDEIDEGRGQINHISRALTNRKNISLKFIGNILEQSIRNGVSPHNCFRAQKVDHE